MIEPMKGKLKAKSTLLLSPMVSVLWFMAGFSALATVFTGLVFGYWALGFFLLLVGSGYIAMGGYMIGISQASLQYTRRIYTTTAFNIVVCIIAMLGLCAMFYDRTSLRGIDYANLGMAAARAEFNRVGERGGIISILGNILSAAIYLPLINLIFDWEWWDRRRLLVFALVIANILGLTYITGGRTALLIAVAVAAAAMLGRGVVGMRRLPSFLSTAKLFISIIAVAGLFGGVFALRATAFGASSAAVYLADLCVHLSQPTTEIMVQCSTIAHTGGVHMIDEILNYGIAVLLYAFHVAWVGDTILGAVNPGTLTSFAGVQDMFLGRFGFEIMATDYDGYFIPAAASLVYDFGYLEMGLSFAVLGILAGVFQTRMRSGHFFLGRIAFSFAIAGLLISVMISPANLPVILLSFMATVAIAIVTWFASAVGILRPTRPLGQPARGTRYRRRNPRFPR